MKKTFLWLPLFAVFILSAFTLSDHNLVGHWVTYTPDNSKVLVDFNNDGTFKVTVDGQTENEGKYKLNQDTFFMYDNNCGMETEGKYKLTFYGEDSLSFSLIEDPCADRSENVNGGTIKRLADN
jgi:hypothetical protein